METKLIITLTDAFKKNRRHSYQHFNAELSDAILYSLGNSLAGLQEGECAGVVRQNNIKLEPEAAKLTAEKLQ